VGRKTLTQSISAAHIQHVCTAWYICPVSGVHLSVRLSVARCHCIATTEAIVKPSTVTVTQGSSLLTLTLFVTIQYNGVTSTGHKIHAGYEKFEIFDQSISETI